MTGARPTSSGCRGALRRHVHRQLGRNDELGPDQHSCRPAVRELANQLKPVANLSCERTRPMMRASGSISRIPRGNSVMAAPAISSRAGAGKRKPTAPPFRVRPAQVGSPARKARSMPRCATPVMRRATSPRRRFRKRRSSSCRIPRRSPWMRPGGLTEFVNQGGLLVACRRLAALRRRRASVYGHPGAGMRELFGISVGDGVDWAGLVRTLPGPDDAKRSSAQLFQPGVKIPPEQEKPNALLRYLLRYGGQPVRWCRRRTPPSPRWGRI